jgi:dihydrofolate reductase
MDRPLRLCKAIAIAPGKTPCQYGSMKVFILATQTADGYIARDSDQLSTSWTTRSDKILFSRLTKQAGVVVMGRNTFATIGTGLPGRRVIVYTRQKREPVEGVEFTAEPAADLLKRLEAEGAKGVAVSGGLHIYNLFMETGLVNEFYFTVQPVFFGQGMKMFDLHLDTKLQLVDAAVSAEDGTVTLHYLKAVAS